MQAILFVRLPHSPRRFANWSAPCEIESGTSAANRGARLDRRARATAKRGRDFARGANDGRRRQLATRDDDDERRRRDARADDDGDDGERRF